jgi:uncharacterized membrane protein
MSPEINNWLQLVFRWLHVLAGVMWIGHLWFFNFVNGPLAKTYDADSKKKVVPELMPRALYWFRWGAAYTWITGILLLAFVYYMGGQLVPVENPKLSVGVGSVVSLAILIVAFAIYDVMWKALAKQEMAGMAISLVLTVGLAFGLAQIYNGRAVPIHIGATFGTIMAANVWMRIWPNQRKIIWAIKNGSAPDAALVATAGLRSKHNTYMSFPLILMMIANHFSGILYGTANDPIYVPLFIGGFVAAGWGAAKFCYSKSGSDAPKQFAPADAAAPESAAK